MDMRELKGLELAARARITWKDGVWLVPSQSSATTTYRVTLNPDKCECEDFALTAKPCKHVHAAKAVRQRDGGDAAPPVDTDVIPKRPTYKQNWPLYDQAQMTEKRRFLTLLADLCRDVQDPLEKKGRPGPKRIPMRDQVFASALKVYTTFSSRRYNCDLEDATAKGYMSRKIHSVSVCAFLESEALTPVLSALIVRSSLPLRAVETVFAPDSTGFSTSRFVRWFDEKYGVERSGHDWVKAHIMTGVKTNVITAAEIHGRDANDSPIMPSLLQTTAQNFTIRAVPCDKGYLSHENLAVVEALGAAPYIPFKSNSVAGEAGTLWERMFHYYQFRRDEFLGFYHQRSNVESTFSMVKAKFRDHVRSKTDTAMKNEVLCKLLCHNIVVVHQSQVELGIEPVFWQNEPEPESRDVLPMVRRG